MPLTKRSKIAIYWTTNPADMGYNGTRSDWLDRKPEMRSPRTALMFGAELTRRVGDCDILIRYMHNRREVSLDELRLAAYE